MNFAQNFCADILPQLEYLLRILIACLCGGAIGIERTLRQKDAGFRTHVIVALGASLMMVVSKYGFADSLAAGYDPAPERIASNIITGISFLGAGMIFVRGANIKGLTTAAGVWSTAAVAMAIGAGMYITGILASLIIVLIQILFHTFLIGFDKVLANDRTTELILRAKNDPVLIAEIKGILTDNGFTIDSTKVELNGDETLTLALTLKSVKHAELEQAVELIGMKGVNLVSF
ncbi:MAG: MgtC/SapB family protein [Clostridia bacterium]|nr:MgtC/SapB family protein [Clostridia bacterium]